MPDDKKAKAKGPSFAIFINGRELYTSEHQLTGAQIKQLAGLPGDYELFQVTGEKTVTVGNEESVHIANKLHFRAIPAGTFGAHDAAAQA